jgi:hypothetical protein
VVLRIGVVTEPLGSLDSPALRFLILKLNSLQRSFEFELVTPTDGDRLLTQLGGTSVVERSQIKEGLVALAGRLQARMASEIKQFGCSEQPSDKFVILTTARFMDNFMSTRAPDSGPVCSVIALGHWERSMAPPTLIEFFLVLLLRHAVAFVSPTLSGSGHLGTKGCLFDFNRNLAEVRYKVLGGFVCSSCSDSLVRDGHPDLQQELVNILSMRWLGSLAEPHSPAAIAAKFSHNLFIVKGLRPTSWETLRSALQEEGLKQALTVIGAVLGAAISFFLGFNAGSG